MFRQSSLRTQQSTSLAWSTCLTPTPTEPWRVMSTKPSQVLQKFAVKVNFYLENLDQRLIRTPGAERTTGRAQVIAKMQPLANIIPTSLATSRQAKCFLFVFLLPSDNYPIHRVCGNLPQKITIGQITKTGLPIFVSFFQT